MPTKRKTVVKASQAKVKRTVTKTVVKANQAKIKRTVANTKGPIPSTRLRAMRAVVINLRSRPDRWEGLKRSASKNAPWLRMTRMDAVDGRVTPPPVTEVSKKWSTGRLATLFPCYRSKTIPMSPGERGCCASHLNAWKVCAKNDKPLIVLEDDAVLLPSFTATLTQAIQEAPSGTGAIWITSKDRGTRKRFGKVLMHPEYVWTTVGYIIWPDAARAFMKLLPMDMPVDNFMAWHIKEGTVKTYSVLPAAVRQANTWNIGSDVPHSDDVALW